jgi:hypothetical protein
MELDRNDIISRMQSKITTIDDFNFDKLSCPPLYSLFTMQDIDSLYNIATSIRYSGNPRKKYKAIDDIMKPRGFVKLSAGTNRVVYRFLEDTSFVVKVAADDVGIHDTPREFINQNIFKPFVTKCFEVDPTGVVGTFERVNPITSREEFASVADDIYEILTKWFIGEYVLADVGSKFFMNYGFRKLNNFGPVLLDFPYVYKLDGNKMFCTAPDNNSPTKICGGLIDYDDGFNFLRCEKCGVRYRVADLAKRVEDKTIIIKGNGERRTKMKVEIIRKGVTFSQAEEQEHATMIDKIPVAKVEPKKVVSAVGTLKAGFSRVEVKKVEKPEGEVVVSDPREKFHNNHNQSNHQNNNWQHKNNNFNNHNNQSNNGKYVSRFTVPEIEKFEFGVSSFDSEYGVLTLISQNLSTPIRISVDLSKANEEVKQRIFGFQKEDSSEELEQAKADLLAKEEALEAEKEANQSLTKQLDEAQEEIKKLYSPIGDFQDQHDAEVKRNDELQKELEEVTAANSLLLAENNGLKDVTTKHLKKIDELNKAIEEKRPLTVGTHKVDNLDYSEFTGSSYIKAIDYSEFTGFSCIKAIVSSFKTLKPDAGFKNDYRVLVLSDGEGDCFTDQDGNVIAITDINEITVDSITTDYDVVIGSECGDNTDDEVVESSEETEESESTDAEEEPEETESNMVEAPVGSQQQ